VGADHDRTPTLCRIERLDGGFDVSNRAAGNLEDLRRWPVTEGA
jgi:hypothetical protein